MAKSIVPLRPKDFVSNLSQPEQACLTWYVLSGCTKRDAFITFARPDMLGSKAKGAVEEYIKQFFSTKDARDYIEAYEKTLNLFLHPELTKTVDTGSLEERKAKAKTKLVEFAMSLADNIDRAEDPEFVLKMADKAGILGGDEEIVEQPRRYLPVTCSDCAYRKFVEENCDKTEDSGTEIE